MVNIWEIDGWDGNDTPLKLEYLQGVLADKLRWPSDPADSEAWRKLWRSPFRHRPGHVIRKSDELAQELAKLARAIRDRAQAAVEIKQRRRRHRDDRLELLGWHALLGVIATQAVEDEILDFVRIGECDVLPARHRTHGVAFAHPGDVKTRELTETHDDSVRAIDRVTERGLPNAGACRGGRAANA